MRIAEYCAMTGLEERTARRHCAAGKIAGRKIGGVWEISVAQDAEPTATVTITFRGMSLSRAMELLGGTR